MANPREPARTVQENFPIFRILRVISRLIGRECAQPQQPELHGVRTGELWKVSRFQKHHGITDRLMKAWHSKGLILKDLGSDSPFLLTDDFIQFYRSQPPMIPKTGIGDTQAGAK